MYLNFLVNQTKNSRLHFYQQVQRHFKLFVLMPNMVAIMKVWRTYGFDVANIKWPFITKNWIDSKVDNRYQILSDEVNRSYYNNFWHDEKDWFVECSRANHWAASVSVAAKQYVPACLPARSLARPSARLLALPMHLVVSLNFKRSNRILIGSINSMRYKQMAVKEAHIGRSSAQTYIPTNRPSDRPTEHFKQTHSVHESYEQNRMSTERK